MPELPRHSIQARHDAHSGYGISPRCTSRSLSVMFYSTQARQKTGTAEPSADFNSIIQDSLLREVTYKATCLFCRRVAVFESRRSLATKDLPPVLAVNTSVFNQENIKFWLDVKKRRFLTPSISLHGQIDGTDDPETAVYELRVRLLPAPAGAPFMKCIGIVPRCTGCHATPALPLGRYRKRYGSANIEGFMRLTVISST